MIVDEKSEESLLAVPSDKISLEFLPCAVMRLSSAGVIEAANTRCKKLFTRDVMGERFSDLMADEIEDRASSPGSIHLKKGYDVMMSTEPLSDGRGQWIVLFDITCFNREAQNEIQQQHLSLMGAQLSKLTHQIRTPLSSSILYAGNLKEQNLNIDQRNKFTDKLLRSLNDLNTTVNNVLLYSKGDNMAASRISIVVLKRMVEDRLLEFSQQYDMIFDLSFVISPLFKYNIIDSEEQFPFEIIGNLNALGHVVDNVINNAIEASSLHCYIKCHITVVKKENNKYYIEISFKDNGCGFPQSIKSSITKPFYSTKESGTGLGLSICEAVCQAHKGYFKIESQTIDKGAFIKFSIPLVKC
jgi:two-component system sensor histidine kinase FlrB